MITQLQAIVRQVAKEVIMPYFLRVGRDKKDDGSLFTEADLASQSALEQALPSIINCPVLGEEMPTQVQKDLWSKQGKLGLWVVDPIDGTTNFANGLPHFAVSVAHVSYGKSDLAVIFNPCSDEMFYAVRGGGAFLNGIKLPLRQSAHSIKESLASVEVKYLKSGKLSSRLQSIAPCGSVRSFGSSTLDWCFLASGRFDLYLHGGQKLWDYCAGALIFEEAGGLWATLEGDDFWSGENTFQRSVIGALQPELFDKWLKWVRVNQ